MKAVKTAERLHGRGNESPADASSPMLDGHAECLAPAGSDALGDRWALAPSMSPSRLRRFRCMRIDTAPPIARRRRSRLPYLQPAVIALPPELPPKSPGYAWRTRRDGAAAVAPEYRLL